MIIGLPKEIKDNENRVGLVPAGVQALRAAGHTLLVEHDAGLGSGIPDEQYEAAGARILKTADEVFREAEMIVKVKEPQPQEVGRLQPHHTLFTYLHLAADATLTEGLMASGATCIAYETVTDARGVSGTNAARMAMGMEAYVTVIDKSLHRLYELDLQFGSQLHTLFSTVENIENEVLEADLVIGAVLVPGAAAPKLVTHDMVERMKPGSVIVDIAIDQGGCFETSRPTTHAQPTYVEHGVVHYCVTNMPGAVARTSTFALNNATLPFVVALADKGWRKALLDDINLRHGLNVHAGAVTFEAVANDLGLPFAPAEKALG